MPNIGDPMDPIPAVGSSGTAYATEINEFLTEVKDRLEAEVPRSSLADGNLDMNSYPVQNASYLGLENQVSAPTTPSNSFQAYGGDVYWINTGGAVQLTSGTSLNTALLGGITGDYGGANPAQFRFVDADQEFYAYDDYAGGAWARVWAKNFDIAAGASSSNRVRLAYATAASYTLTLPATPVSDAVLQMNSSGTVTASNTLTQNLTVPDLKLSSNREMAIPSSMWVDSGSTHTKSIPAGWTLANNITPIVVPVPLDAGDQIVSIVVYCNKSSSAANTVSARVDEYNTAGVQTTAIGSAGVTATGLQPITISSGLPYTLLADKTYFIQLQQNTNVAGDTFTFCKIVYKRP